MPVNLHCRYHLQQINFSLVDGVVVPYLFRFSNADFWILKITIFTSLYTSSLLACRHWPKYFVVTNSLHYLFLFLIIFSDGCIRHDELYFSCSMRAAIFSFEFRLPYFKQRCIPRSLRESLLFDSNFLVFTFRAFIVVYTHCRFFLEFMMKNVLKRIACCPRFICCKIYKAFMMLP